MPFIMKETKVQIARNNGELVEGSSIFLSKQRGPGQLSRIMGRSRTRSLVIVNHYKSDMTTDRTNHFIDVPQTSSLGSQLKIRLLKFCDHPSDFKDTAAHASHSFRTIPVQKDTINLPARDANNNHPPKQPALNSNLRGRVQHELKYLQSSVSRACRMVWKYKCRIAAAQ